MESPSPDAARPLIGPGDPPAVETLTPNGRAPLLLVCDHASCRLPAALNGLGVPADELRRHIGWDIGAAAVARQLSERIDAPAVLAGYSRLLIDCNRYPRDPELIREVSDGAVLRGNIGLDAAARAARLNEIYWPYHAAVEAQVERMVAIHGAIAVLAVHSFSPSYGESPRPWHVGVLWDEDGRLAQPLIGALEADGDLVVGSNVPYSGAHPADFTLDHHAEARGLAHASIEIRQDLIDSESGCAAWAERLAGILPGLTAA